MSHFLWFIFCIVAALCQSQTEDAASFCGCNIHRKYGAYDEPEPYYYDMPGDCSYYCRSTRLSYYNKHMTKEIRVVSVYHDPAGNIDLILCSGNNTALTKPIVLYLTSYDPTNWVIRSNDSYIVENIVFDEVYAEYFVRDKGKSTVRFENIFSQSPNPKIIIKSGDQWNGFGEDEESNQILYNVQERYNLELYSFCGGYAGDLVLCVGEQDIVNNNNDYPNDDQYEQCKIPSSPLKNMLYVLGIFGFCWVICCGLVLLCIKRQMKAVEKQRLERLQREKKVLATDKNRKNVNDVYVEWRLEMQRVRKKNANDLNVERRLEMERVRKKNANVYVGEEQHIENKQSKQGKYEDNYNDALEDELAKSEQFERKISNNNKEQIISKQPTLSYSAMSCVICLDVLLENEATKLFCGHRFHTNCIEEYNENNSNCPLCRKTIEY